MSNLLETLKQVDVLQGISAAEFEKIASIADEVDFKEGDVLFRENSPAESIYLIVQGHVSLELCAPGVGCRRILTVGKGELLGWSPVLEHARFTATSRALTSVQTIKIAGTALLNVCDSDPRLGYHFMQRVALALSKRLTATRLQLLNVFENETPSLPFDSYTD